MILIYTFYFKSRCVEMVLKHVFVISSDSWGCCPSFLGLPLLACSPGLCLVVSTQPGSDLCGSSLVICGNLQTWPCVLTFCQKCSH